MLFPKIFTILPPPASLTAKEKDEYINATISNFMSTGAPGLFEKLTPSLRHIGDNYELIYFSTSKTDLSATTKAKVDSAAQEIQPKVDTFPTPNPGPARLELAKGHKGSAGIPPPKTTA